MGKNIDKNKILPSKFIYLCFSFLFLISLTSASYGFNDENLGTFKQGSDINLIQTCSNCTYNNISTIIFADGTLFSVDKQMTKNGSFYNLTFNSDNTYSIGEYVVNGIGDSNGIEDVWTYRFNVKGGSIAFFILIFVFVYGLTFTGVKMKNSWVGLIGAMGLLSLGIYTSFNGIDTFKNNLTDAVSYINIAIGLGIGFESLREITNLG